MKFLKQVEDIFINFLLQSIKPYQTTWTNSNEILSQFFLIFIEVFVLVNFFNCSGGRKNVQKPNILKNSSINSAKKKKKVGGGNILL